ncbi:unnamed protein product [Linum tenue]|uniref:Late embryogenesis abundant protein LEA-2 subgroup domain-containing protein n=1 Tax=Linum tenue TaxID=586396 RepID=A0AAV0I1A2_9ROSI|nr:unnamed protein product [Linum tenue]
MGRSSSSSDDDSPKKHKKAASTSFNDGQHPPPPYPPAYPPGYNNQYPPGYNYNYAGYNYPAQAPPAAYYHNNGAGAYPTQQEMNAAAGFARGFLIGMMLLFFCIFASTIVLWVVLRPQVPEFHVESLAVANFDAKQSSFAAAWDANLTAKNPNTKIRLYFNQIETFMFYDDQPLASSYANPFSLETGAAAGMTTRLATNSSVDEEVENEAVEKMAEDYNGPGAVEFSLRMAVWTTFKSDSWWTRRSTVRVFCEELKVAFVGKTGKGSLAPDTNRDCLVFV